MILSDIKLFTSSECWDSMVVSFMAGTKIGPGRIVAALPDGPENPGWAETGRVVPLCRDYLPPKGTFAPQLRINVGYDTT